MKTPIRLRADLFPAGSESKEPPPEFRILPFGGADTSKGTYKFDSEMAARCMAAYRDQGNEVPIDYEHQMLADPPIQAPAAGWFTLEVRPDGLWATNVRWTPTADKMLRAGEYRYFSPAFVPDGEGGVESLLNVALTNLPATKHQQPLVAAKTETTTEPGGVPPPPKEKPMKTLFAALSLKEDATEAEALSALSRKIDFEKEIVALTGKPGVSEALGVVAGWKQAHEKVEQLSAKIAKIEAEKVEVEVNALVDAGIKDGKITPARREWALNLGRKDLVSLKTFLETASPNNVVTSQTQEPAAPVVTLSAVELQTAKDMKIDPKIYAARKAELAAASR